jgi:hypothetical protein
VSPVGNLATVCQTAGYVFHLTGSVGRPPADKDDNNRKDAHRNGANGKVIMLNPQASPTRQLIALDGVFLTDSVHGLAASHALHARRNRRDESAAHTSALPNN